MVPNGISASTNTAPSSNARRGLVSRTMPVSSSKEAAVALATLASPVRSVKFGIGQFFHALIQPCAGELDMFDEASVPGVDEMEVAVVRLNQVRVGELEITDLCLAFISPGGFRIASCVGDARLGSLGSFTGGLHIARWFGGLAALVFQLVNRFPGG